MEPKGFNQPTAPSQLHFQDFTFDSADKSEPPPDYEETTIYTANADTEELLTPQERPKQPSFWDFAYYMSFWDVDTDQVKNRIAWSMIPLPGGATFLHRCIRPNPDLYGPFWICATLVFTIAMGGNLADYLHTAGRQRETWHYDFNKVSIAATTIYSYAFLVPLGLWALMRYRNNSTGYSLLEMICIYGYSMAIYVPISILCIVQLWWLQWTTVILGAMLSGTVLLLTMWPAFKEDGTKIKFSVLGLLLFLHILLAVCFLAYFFQPNQNLPSVDLVNSPALIHVEMTTKAAEKMIVHNNSTTIKNLTA